MPINRKVICVLQSQPITLFDAGLSQIGAECSCCGWSKVSMSSSAELSELRSCALRHSAECRNTKSAMGGAIGFHVDAADMTPTTPIRVPEYLRESAR